MDDSNTTPALDCSLSKRPPYEQPKTQKEAKDNLRYFRKRAGLSQTSIAKAFSLRPAAVNRWESHSTDCFIPLEKVDTVAKMLRVDPKALIVYRADRDALSKAGANFVVDPHTQAPLQVNMNPTTLEDFKKNLKYFRVKNGYTQREVCAKLGLSSSMASTWERLDSPSMPTREAIERLALFYTTDPRLISPPIDSPEPHKDIPSQNVKAPTLLHDENRIYDNKSNIRHISLVSPNDPILNLQTRACASAGPEFPAELQFDASVSELLGIHYNKGLAAAKVIGDSMFNPETGMGIPDGAIVLIDTTKRDLVEAIGKIVCFEAFGCYLVKRLRCNSSGVINAVSDNPHYFPLFYDDVDNIHLIGEVVSVLMSARSM